MSATSAMTDTAAATTATATATFLGIDLAKAKFDAALLTPGSKPKHTTFPNTQEGFEQLAAWLACHGITG